jgi:hypothetical protein
MGLHPDYFRGLLYAVLWTLVQDFLVQVSWGIAAAQGCAHYLMAVGGAGNVSG